MMDWLSENWYLVALVIYLIIVKFRRHSETKEKDKREQGVKDAENLVLALVNNVNRENDDPLNRIGKLNELAKDVPDGNLYKRVLIDGVTHLCEKDPEKKFTPVEGEHPLIAMANRAVEAETKKAKRNRALKAAGRIGVSIVKAIL